METARVYFAGERKILMKIVNKIHRGLETRQKKKKMKRDMEATMFWSVFLTLMEEDWSLV